MGIEPHTGKGSEMEEDARPRYVKPSIPYSHAMIQVIGPYPKDMERISETLAEYIGHRGDITLFWHDETKTFDGVLKSKDDAISYSELPHTRDGKFSFAITVMYPKRLVEAIDVWLGVLRLKVPSLHVIGMLELNGRQPMHERA